MANPAGKKPDSAIGATLNALWPAAFVFILFPIVVPVQPWTMDAMLAVSVGIGLLVFLMTFYVNKPTEFSVFPTVLLFTTLYRLSLNVGSTRLILLHGHEGSDAAGHLIETFGHLMVSGDFVVGLVVFILLVIINFFVITKGATRIAEVAARFTLDALPGKQMAIDADLSSGLLTEEQARERRKDIALESEFYGAMDGASKFIRGDAIAGMLITGINIIGGLIVGVARHGITLGEATSVYTILTVGDGLVSQIPALIISVSAGVIVTRVGDGQRLDTQIGKQFLSNPKVLIALAALLLALMLIPGLRAPFLALGLGVAFLAWRATRAAKEKAAVAKTTKPTRGPRDAAEPVEELLTLDTLSMEVGYDLVPLADPRRGGELNERVQRLRRQLAKDMGILVPPIHIRDNVQLKPGEYKVMLRGTEVARGEILPRHMMAIDPGNARRKIRGTPGKEPAFGLDALWIKPDQVQEARASGYTVVDPPNIITTHISEVIKGYSPELIDRQALHRILDAVAKTHPKVVDDLVPNTLSLGIVLKVVRNLLTENVSVRDMLTILETLADEGERTKDVSELSEAVRRRLARQLTRQYEDDRGKLRCLVLHPTLEEKLREGLRVDDAGAQIAVEPVLLRELVQNLGKAVERHARGDRFPVVLTSPSLRRPLRRLIERVLPTVGVLSSGEIAHTAQVENLGMVGA
jgi:flagellar biosynthesis protein FlhA